MTTEIEPMDSMIHVLAELASRPLGTLVYLGADGAAVSALLRLPAQKLVLVQGDPDEASELRLMAAAEGARLEVIEAAAMPSAGVVRWHRYNVSALNGPLDASGLVRHYPRLRQAGMLSVPARSLAELLDTACGSPGGGPDVLVLDLPGQELALLGGLPPDQLERFDSVLVRACGASVGDQWCTAAETQDHVVKRGWRALATTAPQDALWPVLLFQFDHEAHKQRLRDERLVALEAQSDDLGHRLRQVQRERDHAIATAEAERARLAAEALEVRQQLQREQQALAVALQANEQLILERDESRQLAAGREHRLAETEAACAELERRATESTRAHALHVARLQEAEGVIEQVRAELRRSSDATQAREEEIKSLRSALAQATDGLQDALAARTRAQAEAEATRVQLSQQLAELRSERDTLQKTADHRAGRIKEGEAGLNSLRQTVASLEAKLQAAQAEVQRQAEAAELAAKQRVAGEAAEKTRQQLEAQVKSLLGQLDAGKAEVSKLTSERDAAKKALVDLELRQSALEQEATDLRQRLDLMHQELSKADGQLELLRELILQEPTV